MLKVVSHSILLTMSHFSGGETGVKQVKQLAEPGMEPGDDDSSPRAPAASVPSSQRFRPGSRGLVCAGAGTGRSGASGSEKVEASEEE